MQFYLGWRCAGRLIELLLLLLLPVWRAVWRHELSARGLWQLAHVDHPALIHRRTARDALLLLCRWREVGDQEWSPDLLKTWSALRSTQRVKALPGVGLAAICKRQAGKDVPTAGVPKRNRQNKID